MLHLGHSRCQNRNKMLDGQTLVNQLVQQMDYFLVTAIGLEIVDCVNWCKMSNSIGGLAVHQRLPVGESSPKKTRKDDAWHFCWKLWCVTQNVDHKVQNSFSTRGCFPTFKDHILATWPRTPAFLHESGPGFLASESGRIVAISLDSRIFLPCVQVI